MMGYRLLAGLRAVLLASLMLAGLALPGVAQTQQLSDDQIRTIEYHFKLDQFMVGGCILGATFGAITGLMTLSGMSVIASVPYISTGCSLGFLVGPASMFVHDFLYPPSPQPQVTPRPWHWPWTRD